MRKPVSIFASLLLSASISPAGAQTINFELFDYGPFDDTNPEHVREHLPVVEKYHFNAGVENLTKSVDNKAELLVVLIPTHFQVHERYWTEQLETSPAMQESEWDLNKPNRILAKFLTDNQIPFVDLLSEFRERATLTGEEYYLSIDKHWNKAGHILAAELVAAELDARYSKSMPKN